MFLSAFLRFFLICLLCSVALPAAAVGSAGEASSAATPPAAEAATQPSQRHREQETAMYERRRSELENKLRVERVLLKGTAEKGVEIESSYRIGDGEGVFDVGANMVGGGGGDAEANGIGQTAAHVDELPIFGAEVMAPFADAVSFVDGEAVYLNIAQEV